jgi:very-short-patch-repair endonuclease
LSGLRSIHDGVYVTGWGAITDRQRWWGAVLTAPGTVLSHAAAAALQGLRPAPPVPTVTRRGTRGRTQSEGVLVLYSSTLSGNVTEVDGIPVTTVERTIIDLWPHLGPWAREKLLREAFRLRPTTGPAMLAAIRRHRGRRGVASLRVAVEALCVLQLERCKSDAEAMAVVLIAERRREPPEVNAEIAGEEADLSWPQHRVIIELDGPQFHVLRDADLRKQRTWEAAGWEVRRSPTDAVFNDQDGFMACVPAPNVPPVGA